MAISTIELYQIYEEHHNVQENSNKKYSSLFFGKYGKTAHEHRGKLLDELIRMNRIARRNKINVESS